MEPEPPRPATPPVPLLRRVVPIALLVGLASGNVVLVQREIGLTRSLGDRDASLHHAEKRAGDADERVRSAEASIEGATAALRAQKDDLEKARAAVHDAEERLRLSEKGESEALARARADL